MESSEFQRNDRNLNFTKYAYLMEIIKVFTLETTRKCQTVQSLTRADVHRKKMVLTHLAHEFVRGLGTCIFKFTCFNSQGVTDFTDCETELEVGFTVIK